MDAKSDGVNTPGDIPGTPGSAGDLSLMAAARNGDRLAFGLLYLRHHAAAWRVACVATRFSADAELAVIEGFTRIFSALPEHPEDSGAGGVSFRPYLLACVRQAALDRARVAGRADAASGAGSGPGSPEPVPLAGLGPDGEVVLCDLEHHYVRGALAALPERSRTALWLSDVEAMTPTEMAGILGGDPPAVAALAAAARAGIRRSQEAALSRHEVRAGCRFSADHLDVYRAGTLDPADGVTVRAHLEECPPCRMRHEELANGPAALAAAVPDAPLLGGEAQQHWLSAADLGPAARLLPPGAAAAGAGALTRSPLARLLPPAVAAAGAGALRRAGRAATGSWRPKPDAVDLTDPRGPDVSAGWTGSPGPSGSMTPPLPPAWTIPPGRAAKPHPRRPPGRVATVARRAKDTAWPALPAVGLAVAWVVVMLALPWLMTPGTAPGPDGEVLPAVQAYAPGYLPGTAGERPGTHSAGGRSGTGAGLSSSGLSGVALAAPPSEDAGQAMAASADGTAGGLGGEPVVGLVSAVTPRSRPAIQAPNPGRLAAPAPALVPVAVAAITSVPPVTSTPLPAPAATTGTGSGGQPARPGKASRHSKGQRRTDPVTAATVPEPPSPTTTTTTTTTTGSGGRGGDGNRKHGGPRRIVSA